MPLCETVILLAEAVEEQSTVPLTDREQAWITAIKKIVEFRDQSRLDLWEAAVNQAGLQDSQPATQTEELLAEIEMLGMCNLYQEFQVERTREYYDRLVRFFTERGVEISISPDLSGW